MKPSLPRRFLPLLLALAAPASAQAPAPAPVKTKITSAADLPVHTYAVASKVRPLAEDSATVAALATAVSRDIRGDLAAYDIADRAAQRRLYLALLDADALQGDAKDAHTDAAQIRRLEDKPEDRALSGTLGEALLDARQNPGASCSSRRQAIRTRTFSSISGYGFVCVVVVSPF